jgi:class 3 adenylate cyclase
MVTERAPTSPADGPRSLPERGPLAIVYTDIERSTALTEALGDAAARRLLRSHDEIVRREVRGHGGVELQPLGDGFKLAFETARDAVACAVAIQSALAELNRELETPLLSVRIGVNSGEPIRERGDLFGEAVILGQRVMSRASGGRIYATEAARDAAGELPGVRWLERGLYQLKGFERGFRVFEAVWAPEEVIARAWPGAAAETRDARWRGTAFVGRARELRQLERCLDEACEGQPRIALVTGEAGIGKSRLIAEFLGLVALRPVALASGRCFADLAEPFRPFLDCLRQLHAALPAAALPGHLVAELAPLARLEPDLRDWLTVAPAGDATGTPEEERLRLLGAIAGLLLEWSRDHTLVLAVDDLHWADPQSLDALRTLARRLAPGVRAPRARLLLVTTCRDADLAPDHPAVRCMADVERAHLLSRLPVERFQRDDVERMLRDLRGAEPGVRLTDFVLAHSGGNPYYVEEVFRDLRERSQREPRDPAWVAEVLAAQWRPPRGVKTVLEQRLLRLGEPCLRVLRTAALIGPQFSVDVVRAATGSSDEDVAAALDEAEGAGIAVALPDAHDESYAFQHSLVAEVLVAQIPTARRRRLHRAIAEGLEAKHGDSIAQHPEEACRHWLAAGSLAPPEKLAARAAAAAERALEVHAVADADRFAAAALDAFERLPGSELEQARLRRLRVVTLGRLGRLDEARALADAAIGAFEEQGRGDAANEARAAIASALILNARHRDALGYLEKAIGKRSGPPSAFDGQLLAEYARTLDLLGQSDRMRAIAGELEALSRRLHDPALRGQALLVQRNWYANHTTDVERARALTGRALRNARGRLGSYELLALLESQALLELSTARVGLALSTLDRALELATQTGALAKIVDVRALRALCACYRGEWQRVDEEWGEAMAATREVPGSLRLGQLLWARARVDLWLGRPAPPTPSAEGTYPGIAEFGTAILATLGVVGSERGDPRSEQWLREAERRHPRGGMGLNWLPAAQSLLAGWTNLGRANEAWQWYAPLEPYRPILNLHFTAYELGRTAALCGHREAGDRDLAQALRIARREAMRPYLGLGLQQRARLWLARGRPADRARARRALDAAAETLHALGMRGVPEATSE